MKKTVVSDGELSVLCRELALMIHAGTGVGDGLRLLQEESDPVWASILGGLADSVEQGATLSQALRASGVFPADMAGLAAVGEQAGRPEESLQALSAYYEGRERLSNRIRSALLYPAVLLVLMLVVIGVLLIRVVPVFNQVFESLGGELTGLAGGLLHLGQALSGALPVLLALLAAAAAFLAAFAGSARFRDRLLRSWRARHGDRGLSRSVAAARFAQALSMGMRSGLPVEEALTQSASLLEEYPAAKSRVRDALARMEQGAGLAEALRAAGVFPASSCRMLALGVRSGTGDVVMADIARRLEEQSDQAIERAVGRVEPAMVIGASVLVGIILLSVMLPLMNIMSAIG